MCTPAQVLTAAHCVSDDGGNLVNPGRFAAAVGGLDKTDWAGFKIANVSAIYRHPGWSKATLSNDIALVCSSHLQRK
jgi:secreted trypsin-like serine protease